MYIVEHYHSGRFWIEGEGWATTDESNATCYDRTDAAAIAHQTHGEAVVVMKKKIAVILENAPDCELERRVLEVRDDEDSIDIAVSDVIDSWTLSVGDTIKIREIA